jgi:hypothetical protein
MSIVIRACLFAFILIAGISLSEQRVSACPEPPCCPHGYDHGCAIACTDDVYYPCLDSGGSPEYCAALFDECLYPACCL